MTDVSMRRPSFARCSPTQDEIFTPAPEQRRTTTPPARVVETGCAVAKAASVQTSTAGLEVFRAEGSAVVGAGDEILRIAPIGYVRLDAGGTIVFANVRFATYVRREIGTIEGRSFTDFVLPEDHPRFNKFFVEAMAGSGRPWVQVRVRDRLAATVAVIVQIYQVAGDGSQLVLALFDDRTPRGLEGQATPGQAGWHRGLAAQDAQRRALAVELHNGLAQELTAANMGLCRLAMGLVGQPEHLNVLESVTHRVRYAATALRRMACALHPIALEERGLTAAIEQLVQTKLGDAERGVEGLCIRTQLGAVEGMNSAIALAVYRVFEEALTCAIEHHHAREIELSLQQRGPTLWGAIVDDGDDSAQSANGWMLQSISERLRTHGGELTVESGQGFGTAVFFEVPRSARPC